MVHGFARRLLTDKQPRSAYEMYADPAMVAQTKVFGTTREATIAQWQMMMSRPEAWFHIRNITVAGDVATIRFHGQLAPGNAADVTQHDRLRCGKIIEESYEYKIIKTSGPGNKRRQE